MRRSRNEEPAETCDISGCDDTGERSMSRKKVKDALDKKLKGEGKRVQLCKAHYREFKKATKEDRKLEQLRR